MTFRDITQQGLIFQNIKIREGSSVIKKWKYVWGKASKSYYQLGFWKTFLVMCSPSPLDMGHGIENTVDPHNVHCSKLLMVLYKNFIRIYLIAYILRRIKNKFLRRFLRIDSVVSFIRLDYFKTLNWRSTDVIGDRR